MDGETKGGAPRKKARGETSPKSRAGGPGKPPGEPGRAGGRGTPSGPGTLYLCATPIGNLGDITLRVLETLKSVDLVAAEDTRRTRKLFARHGITSSMVSYREENRERAGRLILSRLEGGEEVALVSDAGTPGISDPGHHLVSLCLERGVRVEVLPGPNAAVTALVASGLPTRRFTFEGFLPRKRGARLRALGELASEPRTMVFYEAPSRVMETLSDIGEVLGERRVALARELTKRFEQVLRGRVSELLEALEGLPARGEYAIVVEGSEEQPGPSMEDALEVVEELRGQGLSLKDAVGRVAEPGSGLSRKELYNTALKRRERP